MRDDPVAERHRRRVARYSKIVRWAKITLPVIALAMIGLIFYAGSDREAAVDLGSAADIAALGAGLKLENPRFAGVTDDGDPFVVTADWALPDGAMPDRIELASPKGELRMGRGRTVSMRSRSGEMRREAERLHLMGDVELTSSDGYRAEAERVEFDLAEKSAVVPGAVTATGPRGDLSADRMRVHRSDPDSRKMTVVFEGNVRVVYRPARAVAE